MLAHLFHKSCFDLIASKYTHGSVKYYTSRELIRRYTKEIYKIIADLTHLGEFIYAKGILYVRGRLLDPGSPKMPKGIFSTEILILPLWIYSTGKRWDVHVSRSTANKKNAAGELTKRRYKHKQKGERLDFAAGDLFAHRSDGPKWLCERERTNSKLDSRHLTIYKSSSSLFHALHPLTSPTFTLSKAVGNFSLGWTVLCLAAADKLVCFQEQCMRDWRLEAKFHFSSYSALLAAFLPTQVELTKFSWDCLRKQRNLLFIFTEKQLFALAWTGF